VHLTKRNGYLHAVASAVIAIERKIASWYQGHFIQNANSAGSRCMSLLIILGVTFYFIIHVYILRALKYKSEPALQYLLWKNHIGKKRVGGEVNSIILGDE